MAVRQPGLYRLEVALLTFYGTLLLITPAFSGVIRGQLPIEISTRGAKFAEEADQSAGLNNATIGKLEREIDQISDELFEAERKIDQLQREG